MEKPVKIREGLQLPEFNVTNANVGDCTATYATGDFQRLLFTI